MKRREFLALVGGAALAWPFAVRAQSTRIVRIGFLNTGSLESPESSNVMLDVFRQALRELGYVEGTSFLVEYRTADGKIERFSELAIELVRLGVDVIVASNTPAARAAQQATRTIPIVVPVMGDPVGDGLVASLAQPGGNITGLTFLGPELLPKRLALLKEAIPPVSRVAALWQPGAYGERTMSSMMQETETAARALGVHLGLVAVQEPEDLGRAFSRIVGERADAIIVYPSPMLFTERKRIVELATIHRLPSMSMGREFVEIGGLIAYGASITDLFRRSAAYVAKIARGAKPADLPIEQPTKFELVINVKTAKMLGLVIPPSLLARADEVIE
ncbi:MAG TPA: ABC transporter substrate-binding protein [Stellaceae bacterium]|nr:ABC transporter substrate-binding protein [Stellaceae bacterium]